VLVPQVLAQATVDPGAFEVADRIHDEPFLVTVRGHLETGDPLDDRVYEIAAVSESAAAWIGLRRYEAEMQRVN
jgi:hypothetical protein